MDYLEQRFYLSIQKACLLLKDLELILNIAKQNIEKEKLTDPYLTNLILDNYIDIINNCQLSFENLYSKKVSEMDLDAINGWSSGFGRSFENPLLNSEEWYQKVVDITKQLNECFREIVNFLEIKNV